MIGDILPAVVSAADAFEDTSDAEELLFAEEAAVVARAVHARRSAFATARDCAHQALVGLGVASAAILSDERGAPCWPDGIVGSITHCDGYRGSAVAWKRDVAYIGIDAEPNAALPCGVLRRISLTEERRHIEKLQRDHPGISWDRLLFSAKESVYKAWYPLTRRWLGCQDAVVSVNVDDKTFHVQLLISGPPTIAGMSLSAFSGNWLCTADLILTAVVEMVATMS